MIIDDNRMSFTTIPHGYITPNGNVVMNDGTHGVITPNKNIIITNPINPSSTNTIPPSSTKPPSRFLSQLMEAKARGKANP